MSCYIIVHECAAICGARVHVIYLEGKCGKLQPTPYESIIRKHLAQDSLLCIDCLVCTGHPHQMNLLRINNYHILYRTGGGKKNIAWPPGLS